MKLKRIITCVKQVPDPEAPFAAIHIDSEAKKLSVRGLPPVINPYDRNALEAAIRMKEEIGAEMIVLSMGEKISEPILRNTIALGADRLILLKDAKFGELDSPSTAYVLSKAISKIGEYDLVLTGRQAGDWDSGQTGILLGEMLGIPSIHLAGGVKSNNGKLVVKKMIADGYELVETEMPVLVTVSSEVGELRYPSLKKVMEARKQPIEVWNGKDLTIDQENLKAIEIVALLPPEEMKRDCQFIDGNSPEEKGKNLAVALKQLVQELSKYIPI